MRRPAVGLESRGMGRGLLIVALLIGSRAPAVARPPAAPAASLERQFLKHAPQILRDLRARDHRNVGVLKFRIKKGSEPISDRAGPLHSDFATPLMVALVLADDPGDPLGIIHDADAVAAKIQGANHLTQLGRQKLFTRSYQLGWGEGRVEADAFLTGDVTLDSDGRQITIAILMFDRGGEALVKIAEFTASITPSILTDAGASFVTRGMQDETGRVNYLPEVIPAAKVLQYGPVALEIKYDGTPVQPAFRGEEMLIPAPRPGQRVELVLRKDDATDARYGVVLMVNGLNTLYRERLPARQCRKWVLSLQTPSITVQGFQVDDRKSDQFAVVLAPMLKPVGEPKPNAIDFGPDVGRLTLEVYRQQAEPGRDRVEVPADAEARDVVTIARSAPEMFHEPRPKTSVGLKSRLHNAGAARRDRGDGWEPDLKMPEKPGENGIIVPGVRIDQRIRNVEFQADPTPVMSATITYYQP